MVCYVMLCYVMSRGTRSKKMGMYNFNK